MKTFLTTLLTILLPAYLLAQSITPQVVATAGNYYENSIGSLSWTPGEVAT